jgi:ATP:corrinoid adenosyltransferase
MDGLTHIYCGDGKGKTTAALGLGVRACGRGKRVLLVQFLKGSDSGELNVLNALPNFSVLPNPENIKFIFQMEEAERTETARLCRTRFQKAAQAAAGGACDLLILDEVFGAISTGMLPNKTLIEFIKSKPGNLELVLTGRDPEPEILTLADYVSEILKVKHPFDRNIPARKGIEF